MKSFGMLQHAAAFSAKSNAPCAPGGGMERHGACEGCPQWGV